MYKKITQKQAIILVSGLVLLMSCVYASTSNQYETYYSQVNSNDNISFNPYSHKFYVHRSDGTTERGTFNRTVDDLNNVYYDLRYDNMNAYQQVRVFDNGTILTPHGKIWIIHAHP